MERKFRYGIWKMPEWNGMEDFKNGMEDNLPYFHTNSILDFAIGIYRKKKIRIVVTNIMWKRLVANHLLQINRVFRIMIIVQTVQALHLQIIEYVHCNLQLQ